MAGSRWSTGAGGELASAAALGFARAGASLVITDRDAERLAATAAEVEAIGAECLAVPSDSGDQASIDRVFAALDERFGRVDVLVNAAGINPMQGRPEDFPMDIWALVIDVNLTGYLRFAKAAGRRMIEAGRGGSIINISSIAGDVGARTGQPRLRREQGGRRPDDPRAGGGLGVARHPGQLDPALPVPERRPSGDHRATRRGAHLADRMMSPGSRSGRMG